MKKIIFILTVTFLASCNNQDRTSDVVLDPETKDTLQVIKRYPSNKIKELILYKNNSPSSNLGFTEKGDTLKIPKAVYVKSNHTIFVFIPRQKHYRRISVNLNYSLDKHKDISDTNFNFEPKFIGSFDIPIKDNMIKDKIIKGVIRTMSSDGKQIDIWQFMLTIN